MNLDEIKSLYKAVAVGDHRSIDDNGDDLKYWAAMAREGRWTLPTAIRALVIFRTQRPGEWLDPGHITEIIRDARHKAAATFVVPEEPHGLKPADYPKWYRGQIAAHTDKLLERWASGEAIPVAETVAAELTGGPRQLTSGLNLTTCPEELFDQVKRDFERAGREKADRRRLPTRIRTFVGDPEQRAKARAELEAKRAEMGEQEAS